MKITFSVTGLCLLSSLISTVAAGGPSRKQKNEDLVYTNANGAPVQDPTAFQVVGGSNGDDYKKVGPILLQDSNLIEMLAHFDRERIPERVVHAKGAGAFGYFQLTKPVNDLSDAAFLQPKAVGKKYKALVRFSTVGGEAGSGDSARDPRGFAIKIYTEEGNEDFVCNNTPVFFIRDPSKFPLFIHTQKRNPQTHLKDATAMWDYWNNNQEAIHQIMRLFSDRGTPYSFRHIHAFSGHTYKFVKKDGSFTYVKIHFLTDQGEKWLTNEEATTLAGTNPDHHTQDLFESIESGNFPSWKMYIQTMTPAQAESFKFSVFDLTKTWPEDTYPLREVGKLVLDKNPENYFAEVEQAAFSPSNQVPGIEPSADPVLQARLFSYPDTQRYRLGVNYNQLPVNCPLRANSPFQRDGAHAGFYKNNYGSMPNYQSSMKPMAYKSVPSPSHEEWVGKAVNFSSKVNDGDFEQANGEWLWMEGVGQQDNFVHNVAVALKGAHEDVREETYEMFTRVNGTLGERIREETEKEVKMAGEMKEKRAALF
ncbi:catalase [Ascobolus immersus RN42]|uniref:Catalase n=1 Tax=Ascobolus immersus RN42 TaxID=1160509 RepID=A0A3N4I296_ASCIM|nr:catalase [Ascobolus immersus RN42]